jgi:hypothetical protein
VRQLGDQRTDRVAAVRRLADQAVLLHRQQEPMDGAGGQSGGARQVTDTEIGSAGVEAPQDRRRPVDRLHRPTAGFNFLHSGTLSHDTGNERSLSLREQHDP